MIMKPRKNGFETVLDAEAKRRRTHSGRQTFTETDLLAAKTAKDAQMLQDTFRSFSRLFAALPSWAVNGYLGRQNPPTEPVTSEMNQ
jgi:hypothetical protein